MRVPGRRAFQAKETIVQRPRGRSVPSTTEDQPRGDCGQRKVHERKAGN